MAEDALPMPDPRTVVLTSTGAGTVVFRGQRPTVKMLISKITVESPLTGSGTVAIYFRDQLVTSKAIALLMTATGEMDLRCGEEVRVVFTNGPAGQTLKVTAHYVEVPL